MLVALWTSTAMPMRVNVDGGAATTVTKAVRVCASLPPGPVTVRPTV